MNRKEHMLDWLLENARNAPPVISVDSAKDFLAAHDSSKHLARTLGKRKQTRLIVISGGVMMLITAIILVMGVFSGSDSEVKLREARPARERIQASAAIDDSVKSRNKRGRAIDQTAASQPKGPGITVAVSPQGGTAGQNRSAHAVDTAEFRARSETFAAWTRERIRGCTIYLLDRAELEAIGFRIESDGTIFAPGLPMGMKEDHASGMVTYTFGGMAHGEDSAKIVRHFEELKKGGNATPTTSPEIPKKQRYISPVLVSNSRGRSMIHAEPYGKKLKPSEVGSGQYDGRELIPIRVQVDNETLPSTEADYYYLYWFEPTDAFISSLPDRVQRELKERQNESPAGAIAGADERNTRSRILEAANIHPNPVTSGIATVEYTIQNSCRVALSMYDITGERVRSIAVSEERDSGTWQENVSFEGVPDGYYLLAVTTDKGEQSVRPFILKR
ncbi:MAG: T9SS type A sorting domain-containing protein [Bacteroidetes bacterium]|nr:T9SS type A sorting domain-containing protein [Bacteroidota bacterium]